MIAARWALIVAALFAGCAGDQGERARVEQAKAQVTSDERRLDATEEEVRHLSAMWNRVRAAYDRERENYVAATQRHEAALHSSAVAGATFEAATAEWENAAWLWRVYQQLVQVAAALDAGTIERARRVGVDDLSCESTSLRAYRAMLTAQGVDLTGLDVDHIVPHSLGGPDNIANYQLLDSSLNRSIGAMWGPPKCKLAGDKCAAAIGITTKCNPAFAGWVP